MCQAVCCGKLYGKKFYHRFFGSGGFMTVLAMIFSWFLVAVVRDKNEEKTEQALFAARIMLIAATIYLLSLYGGLQLSVVAWTKRKKAASEKPALNPV